MTRRSIFPPRSFADQQCDAAGDGEEPVRRGLPRKPRTIMTTTPFTVDRAAFETRMVAQTPPEHFLVTEAKTARPVSISMTDHIRCSFIGLVKHISTGGTIQDLREAVSALAQAEKIAEQRQREL